MCALTEEEDRKSECAQLKFKKKKMNGLTVERGQGSSGRATQEAAAVDYGSAACGRENI